MTFRIPNAETLAQCSPAVRAQLEKHFAAVVETGSSVLEVRHVEPEEMLKKRQARPEQEAGALLVKWIDLVVMPNGLRPGEFFYHVANGGGRSRVEAAILIGQGVRKGWPDYGLDLPAAGYHGLRLELKAEDGAKPNDDQLKILARLESVGFKCCVAWGFEEAKAYVEQYLALIVGTTPAAGEARRPPPGRVPENG